MRIRSTKPEFWKSRRIASVDWDARLVLKGLESYVDDNGVGVDDIELIVTDVFPRDMFANPRETVARVSEAIRSLHRAGLVHRYEANGDHLLYISFWEAVQRIDKPGKGRNPRPDGTFDYKESEIRESVASPPETLAPGTGEQGNRGTGEQGACDPAGAGSSSDAASGADATEATTPDAEALSHYLADRIRTNGNKVRTVGKRWHDAMDRLIRIDGYTPEQIRQVIDWSQGNEFWAPNILSAPKLREKFDTLKGQMFNERNRSQRPERMSAADRKLQEGMERHQQLANFTPAPDPFEALARGELTT